VRAGLDDLVAALRETRMMRAGGVLNVSTLSSLLQKWMTPRLHRLHAKFPDLQVDWHTSREAVDFARSDFHAAVRLGQNVVPGLDFEHLMDEWLVVVASPQLFKKHGSIDERDTLKGIPMLQAKDEPWSRFEKSAAPTPWPAGPTIIDDSVSVLSAVIEGLGYAPARWSIAAHDLQSGRLVLASKTIVPSRFRYWFVCPPSYSELPKVCALRSWLKEEAANFPTPDSWLGKT
jgi:LysR family glycine cleavage system transcriptional activator